MQDECTHFIWEARDLLAGLREKGKGRVAHYTASIHGREHSYGADIGGRPQVAAQVGVGRLQVCRARQSRDSRHATEPSQTSVCLVWTYACWCRPQLFTKEKNSVSSPPPPPSLHNSISIQSISVAGLLPQLMKCRCTQEHR